MVNMRAGASGPGQADLVRDEREKYAAESHHLFPARLRHAGLIVMLAATALACLGLFRAGAFPDSIDGAGHVFWFSQFSRSVDEGVLYPTWVDPCDGGHGNPVFLYYPPLAFFIGQLVRPIAGDILTALKTSIFLLLFFGALGVRFLAASLGFSARESLLAGLLYLGSPVLLFLVYGDFLFAYLCAVSIFPWLLLLFSRPFSPITAAIVPPAWALACLAHISCALLFLPWIIPAWFSSSRRRKPLECLACLLLGLLGTAMAAFYLLPAVYSQDLTHIEWLECNRNGRASDNLLFTSPPAGAVPDWKNLGQTLYFIQALNAALLAVSVLVTLTEETAFAESGSIFLFRLFLISSVFFAFTLPPAAFFWDHLPTAGRLVAHIPWRLNILLVPVCALSAARAIGGKLKNPRPAAHLLAWVFTAVSLVFAGVMIYEGFVDQFSPVQLKVWRRVEPYPLREYRPVVAPHLEPYGRPWKPRLLWTPACAGATVLKWRSHLRRIHWQSPVRGRLLVRTFFFPGWRSDGPAPLCDRGSGCICFEMPAGDIVFDIQFTGSKIQTAGRLVSAAALFLWAALCLFLIVKGQGRFTGKTGTS